MFPKKRKYTTETQKQDKKEEDLKKKVEEKKKEQETLAAAVKAALEKAALTGTNDNEYVGDADPNKKKKTSGEADDFPAEQSDGDAFVSVNGLKISGTPIVKKVGRFSAKHVISD